MKNKQLFLSIVLALPLLSGCINTRHLSRRTANIHQIKLVGVQVLPYNMPFNGTITGGLSGIDYDRRRHQYYLISDDRSELSPARFYTARLYISRNGFDSVRLTNVTTLQQPKGNAYPNSKTDPAHTPDPEALRYNAAKDYMVWSSEGERIIRGKDTILANPALFMISREGKYIDTFALPPQFRMQATDNGPRRNGTFEGLDFTPDNKQMYVSLEEPRYEDGPRADVKDTTAFTRIIRYDLSTRQPVAQYAYKLDPVAYPPAPANAFRVNGISDIMVLTGHQLLTIERSFSTGVKSCTIKLYLTDLSGATDVSGVHSLQEDTHFKPAVKTLLFNFESLHRYIDNIEGVTFGPVLPNGHQSLVFVADNNFSREEESQFFVFEIIP